MDSLTKKFIQAHLLYLQNLSEKSLSEEILQYDSLYDHMHAYFLTLGLSSDDAGRVIDDFREKTFKT